MSRLGDIISQMAGAAPAARVEGRTTDHWYRQMTRLGDQLSKVEAAYEQAGANFDRAALKDWQQRTGIFAGYGDEAFERDTSRVRHGQPEQQHSARQER